MLTGSKTSFTRVKTGSSSMDTTMKSPSSEYAPLPPVVPGSYPLQSQQSFSSMDSSSTGSGSQITGFNHQSKPVYGTTVQQQEGNNDPDSEPEDDPGQLLNMWLGELNTLKKVEQLCFDLFCICQWAY